VSREWKFDQKLETETDNSSMEDHGNNRSLMVGEEEGRAEQSRTKSEGADLADISHVQLS
jgi:hypothetical protein